mgnify:CR=1 FL=1
MTCIRRHMLMHMTANASTPQVRGGSVSRRGLTQRQRKYAQLAGGTNSEETTAPNASRSSGEGVWGGGASLREAASSPESPPPVFSGGSAREGAFLKKSPLPRNLSSPSSTRRYRLFAEEQGDAPDTGEGNDCEDYSADDGVLTAENPADNVELKKSD